MPADLDAALILAWARSAVAVLQRHRAEVDRINVFPVADADTGTNLLLTMRSALEAAEAASAGASAGSSPGSSAGSSAGASPGAEVGAVAAALARGALFGARGNSGVILSQVLRGLAEAVTTAPGDGDAVDADVAAGHGEGDGAAVLAAALARGAALADAALTDPREGTALTVLVAAADAAARSRPLASAASAAADAAATALRATTAQLPALARAGVVDAGGMGVYLLLDALAALLTDRPPTAPPLPCARDRALLTASRETGSPEYDYEVMYLLDAPTPAVDALRIRLGDLGDSVAVVGDGHHLWNVHLHCNDIGAAVEAGVAAGRPHRITVIRFADRPAAARFTRSRAVLVVVVGDEVAQLARGAGAAVLERGPGEPVAVDELVAALASTSSRHVVLMPGDPDLVPVAEAAAAAARRDGQDVLVLPTASALQSLSALAVHDPTRRSGEDVVAMADAAAGTRTAALLVAETEALTWVGRCEPGDVLGITDGEVVLIAPDLSVGALWLAHRMLLGGGEIVTALLGAGADAALAEGLVADLHRSHPEVDVVVHRGGQTDYPLVLGVE